MDRKQIRTIRGMGVVALDGEAIRRNVISPHSCVRKIVCEGCRKFQLTSNTDRARWLCGDAPPQKPGRLVSNTLPDTSLDLSSCRVMVDGMGVPDDCCRAFEHEVISQQDPEQ